MTKIAAFPRVYRRRHSKHQVIKGRIGRKKHQIGDAMKWGFATKITEQEANKRQITILRQYIRELKAKKETELSRRDFKKLLQSLTPN